MRSIFALILGALIGFGVALWFQGEPPFAGRSEGSGGITLILSDSYLTAQASSAIASQSGGAVHNIVVSSSSGDIAYVEGQATVSGVSAPVGVSLKPEVANGAVALSIKSAHLGPLPVPDVVTAPLLATINARIAAITSGNTYRVTGVGTTASGIEIFLTP